MNSSQHNRAKALFLELCGLEESEQRRRLAQLDDDTEIRSEVASLLAFHELPSTEAAAGSGSAPGLGARDGPELEPGTHIAERYRIVARIGRGGMGEIYRADDLKLGETVALKFLRPLVGDDHLLNELRLARQVTHPNICRVYDVGEIHGRPFISMEYVDGEDLASLLNRIGRIPADRTVHLAHQLFSGLAAAHAKGVLHRDLKPANIMIDGQGDVRITDFGIASHETAGPEISLQAGTPAYMAPEQLLDDEVSARSDLYSLGLVLYEMCTGRYPFDATSRQEYVDAQVGTVPPPPSARVDDLDPTLERVILKCLEKGPSDRPSSALAVAAALPGGDPLSLAISIGETPSPEMVAEAGSRGVLSARRAGALVALVAGLLLLLLGLAEPAHQLGKAGVDLPPEVLAEKAREKLRAFGWTEEPRSQAHGFLNNLYALEEISADEHRPRDASAPGASTLLFWYRQTPVPLVPSGLENLLYTGGQISAYDPMVTASGSALVMLHPQGTLDHFEVIPERGDVVESPPSAPDRTAIGRPAVDGIDVDLVLEAAGLDPARMAPVAPRFSPPHFADQRFAFRGTTAANPDLELDIRIAGYEGRPTYFRMLPVVTAAAEEQEQAAKRTRTFSSFVEEWYEWWDLVLIACAIAAIPLARNNLRRGRGDRRGAWRLAVVFFFAHLVRWLIQGPHLVDLSIEWSLLQLNLGQGLSTAAQVWIFYLAIEPYVRRIWPHTLISWTRLLNGRHRDTLVGKSMLAGVVFGCSWALTVQLDLLLPRWLGLTYETASVGAFRFDLAQSVAQSLAGVLVAAMQAVYDAVWSILILVLLRLLLRRPAAAVVGYVALVGLLYAPDGLHPAVSWLTYGLILPITEAIVLLRFGLVAFATSALVLELAILYPLTLDTGAWYADTGFFGVGMIVLLTAMGTFYALEPRIGARRRRADLSTDRYTR